MGLYPQVFGDLGEGGVIQFEGVEQSLTVCLHSQVILLQARITYIRELVDSPCRDGADMPRPPYIGKTCTRPNLEDLSLFRYLTIVYESLCAQ